MTTPSPEGETPPTATPAVSGDASTVAPAASDAKANAQQLTIEQAQAIIADLRKESAATRTKLAAFEKAQEEAEQAKLSEIEKANKRAADLEARATAQRTRIASLAVESTARALGIIDPELAALAIQKDLEIDDDGTPKNADALLKKLTQDKPYLLAPAGKPPVTSGGATNPSKSSTNPSSAALSWDVISQMTEAEYTARRAEVSNWIMRNPRPR